MSSTPREIGTLIVVILKARHLPNKRHIGKQDPYCSVYHNGEKRRTKAIKRGGQHPEWDEEVRFTLYEDTEPEQVDNDGVPPPPPPKNEKGIKKIKGGTSMKLACFADDPREPDLIGETTVDLTEVLTKGETDEWFALMHKDKYSGEVYLELTFWSNEPAPQKKTTPRVPQNNKQYGGPGSFAPLSDDNQNGLYPNQRVPSMSSIPQHPRQVSDSYAPMRTSSSLGQLDLYVAPYERKGPYRDVNQVTDDFGTLNVHDGRRRESLPPPSFAGRPSSIGSNSSSINQPMGDRPITPNPAPNVVPHPPVARSARYSIPSTSSGFSPLPNGSNFSSATVQLAEQQLNYAPPPLPPLPPTPHVPMYTGSQGQLSLFSPVPPPPAQSQSQSSLFGPVSPPSPPIQPSLFSPRSSNTPNMPSSSFYQSNHDIQHAYTQSPPVNAQYQSPVHQPPPPQQQQYIGYGPTPSPPREQVNYPSPMPMLPQSASSGSRPLPQPQGPPQVQPLGPSPSRVNPHSYSPNHSQPMTSFPTSPIPPFPPSQPQIGNGSYGLELHSTGALSKVPPPPPPPLALPAGTVRQRRHSSLPQPPVKHGHHPISAYNAIPPPPPPPGQMNNSGSPLTPSSVSFPNHYSSRSQLPNPPTNQYQIAQPNWRIIANE